MKFIIAYMICLAFCLVFNYGLHLGEEELEVTLLEEETPRSILCGK